MDTIKDETRIRNAICSLCYSTGGFLFVIVVVGFFSLRQVFLFCVCRRGWTHLLDEAVLKLTLTHLALSLEGSD